MKIGIVDRLLLDQESILGAAAKGLQYRPPTGYLKDYLLKKGAEVTVAETIAGLAENVEQLSQYNAFLIHPGRDKQRETLQRIEKEAPNSLVAIITFNIDDYIPPEGIAVFSLDSRNYEVLYTSLEERFRSKTA